VGGEAAHGDDLPPGLLGEELEYLVGNPVAGLSDADETHFDGPLRAQVGREGVNVVRNQAGEDVADGDDAFGRVVRLPARLGNTSTASRDTLAHPPMESVYGDHVVGELDEEVDVGPGLVVSVLLRPRGRVVPRARA